MSNFIFVRHDQSKANADNIIADATYPLTEVGRSQAREVAKKINKYNITKVVSSPILRARQTAEEILSELNLSLDIDISDLLKERGLGIEEGTKKRFESEYYLFADAPSLEPPQTLLDRANAFYNYLKNLKIKGDVLITSHAVFGVYLQNAVAGIIDFKDIKKDDELPNAGIFIFN